MASLWKRRFIAASLIVHVEGDVVACRQGVHDLTALFPCAEKTSPPDVVFTIMKHHNNITLTLDGEDVWRSGDAGEMVAAFELNFYHRMVGSLTSKLISLHAATVTVHSRCLTFAGASGSGKSSLCTRALLAGGMYFSDEFTLLDASACVVPFPRPLQWSEKKHPVFPMETMMQSGLFRHAVYRFPDKKGHRVPSLLWLPERVASYPAPPDTVLLPHYAPTVLPAEITPLNRSQALLELSNYLHHGPPAIEGVRLLHARIPSSACFYRLVFSDVHAAWKVLTEGGIIP